MDFPVDILQKLDVVNLLAIGALFWFFNARIDKKLDKIHLDLGNLKIELKGDMNQLRQELKGEMSELKQELKGEMNQLRQELKGEMSELKQELKADIQQLREETIDVDRRLCRIEGSLASKDCCMLKEDRHQLKKAL
jgi:phenylalanyl-tRNA synthetase alpha subunit